MRKRRVHVDGSFLHGIHRGNNREPIYLDETDRRAYLRFLTEGLARFGHSVHAFCLMGNHAHVLVQVDRVPLSVIMHNLAMRYAKWFNRRHGRVGHVFEKRYSSKLVDNDRYLLTAVRYIHANPVRAEIVEDPSEYWWSGHRAYLGLEDVPWLTTDRVLGLLGDSEARARANYGRFVSEVQQQATPDEEGQETEPFVKAKAKPAKPNVDPALSAQLDLIVQKVAEDYKISVSDLQGGRKLGVAAEARAVASCIFIGIPGARHGQVALRFGVSRSAITYGLKVLSARLRKDGTVAARLARIRMLAQTERHREPTQRRS